MNARRLLWIVLPAVALALAACAGGSGSGGFDITSENAAIDRALETQECVAFQDLMVCPTDAASPAPGSEHVDTGLGHSGSVACMQRSPGGPCNFTLPFAPAGFPPDTTFRVAARRSEPETRWEIGTEPVNSGSPSAPNLDAEIDLDVHSTGPGASVPVQFAVLAFLNPPPSLPSEIEHLADSGADFAFVTDPLNTQPQAQ